MIIITIISIILLALLIAWVWNNLSDVDKHIKILYIIIGVLVNYIITLIIFNISKNSIQYPNTEMVRQVKNVLVYLFTPLNGIIIMPYIAKQFAKIKYNEIEQNELKTKILMAMIIFIIIIIIECNYFTSIQNGILEVFQRHINEIK